MIHRFRINNFLSIREDVELDFRIPGTTPEIPCFRRSLSRPDTRLASVAVLVGPNGSGKTALLRAMMETIRFVATSFERQRAATGIPEFVPFLSPETRRAPTRIEVEFDAQWPNSDREESALLTRYSLVLARDSEDHLAPASVDYEALHIFPRGRPRRILERRGAKIVYVSRESGLKPSDQRLSYVPPNASAISTLAGLNVSPFAAIVEDIINVQTNIVGSELWKPGTDPVIRHYLKNQNLVDEVSNQLQCLDLGIGSMKIHVQPDGKRLLIFEHEGLDTPVVLNNESSGTRHLVHILPQLHFVLNTGHLAIMDALDSGFHSELVTEIMGWFRRKETNACNAQLIGSLHNLSVLDDLEKEEVFIVDKDQHGVTSVQRACDFMGIRRATNLQKLYRSGVVGGVPTFG